MGQYYVAVNLTKKQVIIPGAFGDGAKLLEFGTSGSGLMTALAILLADGNGRGGGDLHSERPVIGSWAGDKVVITGDYADKGRFTGRVRSKNLYDVSENYEDVSAKVMAAMLDDQWIAEDVRTRVDHSYEGSSLMVTFEEAGGVLKESA